MPKVFMLGWEFPPLFSGGLGIATYGLVKALSTRARIRLVVPNADSSNDLGNVTIQGLNKITLEEINLERLAYSLPELGADVSMIPLALSPYHHVNEEVSKSNNEFELLQWNKGNVNDVHSIFRDEDAYANILQKIHLYTHLAAQLAVDGDFDIIHAHDWVTYPGGVKIKAQSGKPLVLHVHALETDRSGESCRNKIYHLEKQALDAADKVITVSEYTKNQLARLYQVDSAKISVVHNGIDPAPAVHKEHKLKDKLVVFLGRLTHQKGPGFLIETAEKVLRVYPRVKFVVAGRGDLFVHTLETSAYKQLGGKFIFAGFLSKAKVNELLSMADVYFMPSVSEPFGLSALEAVQFNVPGVISKQSGAAEVVKHTLQADFWDTDKYANYIHALLKYSALKAELTDQAQKELEELTWERASDKVLKIYDEVIKN